MSAENMPSAEVDIDEQLVRALIQEQHPDLADLDLEFVGVGWDNASYRLGPDLVVRLPRRQIAAAAIENEQRWVSVLAPRLPIPVPAAVRRGHATDDYPWAWSICPWMPGTAAAGQTLTDPAGDARRLGEFLDALHQPADPDAPINGFGRGGPLSGRIEIHEQVIKRMGPSLESDGFDLGHIASLWQSCLDAEPWPGPPLWIHGDLHPANMVVDEGRLAGVIDFGDLTGGDPATDLSVAWQLFDPADRAVLRAAHHLADDEATWVRARGWALAFALIYLANSADNETIAGLGRHLLPAVLAGGI